MLHSPELAELVKIRIKQILKTNESHNVAVMLRDLMRDLDKHTGIEKVAHKCFGCGDLTERPTAYCLNCLDEK